MAQRDATTRQSALEMAGIAGLMRWLGFVPWAVLLLAIFVQWRDFGGVLESQRNKVFDYYQNAAPREFKDASVRYIDIDEESIRRIGQWPWPRTTLAKMTGNLRDAGAAVIAFDMVFPEADRTSPDLISKGLPRDPAWDATRTQLLSLPNNDQVFAQTLRTTPSVLGFILGDRDTGGKPVRKAGMAQVGDSESKLIDAVTRFPGATVSLDLLQKAAPGSGSFNTVADSDGIIRRVPLFVAHKGEVYPGLALEALRVAQTDENGHAPTLQATMAGGVGELAVGNPNRIVWIRVGAIRIPSTEDGQMWIHYTRDASNRRIPAWKVLSDPGKLKALEGAAVFVGTSADIFFNLKKANYKIESRMLSIY